VNYISFFILGLILLGGVGMVSATVIYVPDNYSTIQAAIDAAIDGDMIIVRDGIYTENINVNKLLTIISENGSKNCIIQYSNPDSPVFKVTADYVNISGFTVKGAGYIANATGILLRYVNYCNISNNIIQHNYHGILLTSSDNNIVANNNVSDNAYGICLGSSNDNIIRNNLCSDIYFGIDLTGSSNNKLVNNTIKNNNNGLSLVHSNSNIIEENKLVDNELIGIELLNSNRNEIRGNSLVNNGAYVAESYENSIENNTVNSRPLVYLENTSDCTIMNAGQIILVKCSNVTAQNLNLSNASIGIELWETTNSKILDNEISNNRVGIYLWDSSTNIMATNNILNNYCGINMYHSNNNTLMKNNITSSKRFAIQLFNSSNNLIYLNNFIGVTDIYCVGVNIWNSTSPITYVYNDNIYINYMGNYWDSYSGSDTDGDGIGDKPYEIIENHYAKDIYPLMQTWENYLLTPAPTPIPEFTLTGAIALVELLAVLTGVSLARKRQ